MRGVRNDDLKTECLRLRQEERLSLKEIERRTGASRGSLSYWLRDFPLTDEEKWTLQAPARRAARTAALKPRGEESHFWRMARQPLSSSQKGRIAEMAVLFRAALLGLEVFDSPFEGDKTDFIIGSQGKLSRVQVRWARQGDHGLPLVRLQCSDGRGKSRAYRDGEIDFLIGYDLFTDTCFVWSWAEVKNNIKAITVTPDAAERWDKITG